MSVGLAEKQLRLFKWETLRASGGFAGAVPEHLRIMLAAEDDIAVNIACDWLENPIVSQGDLFECAPAVVSVIVAALADGTVPIRNLPPVIDRLGLIIAGYADKSEVLLGREDLREKCHVEARKGYWTLMQIACARDPFNAWELATDVLSVLDPEHSSMFLKPGDTNNSTR
jgi:hypothetical protein